MCTTHVHKTLSSVEWPDIKSGWAESPNCSNWGNLSVIEPEFEKLREWWQLRFEDVMALAPEILPPFREVNHQLILLILKLDILNGGPCALKPWKGNFEKNWLDMNVPIG